MSDVLLSYTSGTYRRVTCVRVIASWSLTRLIEGLCDVQPASQVRELDRVLLSIVAVPVSLGEGKVPRPGPGSKPYDVELQLHVE